MTTSSSNLNENSEVASSPYVDRAMQLGVPLTALIIAWRFGILGLGLESAPALAWAIAVLVVSLICIVTFVGIVIWPFAIAFISGVFGAPPLTWAPGAHVSTLAFHLIAAVMVGGLAGLAIGYILQRLFGSSTTDESRPGPA